MRFHRFLMAAAISGSIPADSLAEAENVVLPKVIKQPAPVYPFAMQRAGIKGKVTVKFVVDAKGRVRAPHVVKSNHPGFRDAAIKAVEKWRFEPGTRDGRKMKTAMGVPIIFEIRDEGGRSAGRSGWTIQRPRKWPKALPETVRWDKAPVLTNFNPPVYPRAALLEGRRGRVQIGFMVGPHGRVLSTRSLEQADADLIQAATAAVQTFEFKPPTRDGKPCGAMLNMQFNFRASPSSDAEVTSEMRRLAKLLKSSPESILTLKELDKVPKALVQQSPARPFWFRQNAVEPVQVKVEFIISKRGEAELAHAVGELDPELAFAAVQAINGWLFAIPRKDGEPVDVRATVPIVFEPSGTKES